MEQSLITARTRHFARHRQPVGRLQDVMVRRVDRGPREVLGGSNWAANAYDDSAQPCQSLRDRPERPHEESDLVPSVVHLATLELACHAGGRNLESTRGDGADITAGSGRAKPLLLDLTADELDNQAELALTQQSLDSTDDPYLAVDGQPLTNFERLLSAQMPGRDHLVAAPKLIAIVDPSHRRTARYAPSTASGTEPARSSPAGRLSEVGLTPAANRQQTSTRSP